jgi:transcriptional regulator with XRE-family HTH domain
MGIDIGSKIIKKRRELCLTQSALAKQAGIAQSTLSYIEKGRKRPQFHTMAAICRVLGISVLELLTFEEQQATKKMFEETMAISGFQAPADQPDDTSLRLLAFEKYLYDMYIARSGP